MRTRRASGTSGRLRGCEGSHSRATVSAAPLRGLTPASRCLRARAHPARPGLGSGRLGCPPIHRVGYVNGAVRADLLIRPARWRCWRDAGLLALGGRPSSRGRPSVDDRAPARCRISRRVRIQSPRTRLLNGAVGAAPLVRPARGGRSRDAGPLAVRGRPAWCGRPPVDDVAVRPLARPFRRHLPPSLGPGDPFRALAASEH